MALMRWEPLDEIDRFFESLGRLPVQKFGFDLAVDVYEEGGNIIAEMHAPGIEKDKVEISVEGDVLKISGVREDKKEKRDKNYFSREIKYGSFHRTVLLPKPVLGDKAKAELKDGTLRITMPVKEITKSQKVKVA